MFITKLLQPYKIVNENTIILKTTVHYLLFTYYQQFSTGMLITLFITTFSV